MPEDHKLIFNSSPSKPMPLSCLFPRCFDEIEVTVLVELNSFRALLIEIPWPSSEKCAVNFGTHTEHLLRNLAVDLRISLG